MVTVGESYLNLNYSMKIYHIDVCINSFKIEVNIRFCASSKFLWDAKITKEVTNEANYMICSVKAKHFLKMKVLTV